MVELLGTLHLLADEERKEKDVCVCECMGVQTGRQPFIWGVGGGPRRPPIAYLTLTLKHDRHSHKCRRNSEKIQLADNSSKV